MSARARKILDDDYAQRRISWPAYAVGDAYRAALVSGSKSAREWWCARLVAALGKDDADLIAEVLTGPPTLAEMAAQRGLRSPESRAKLGWRWRTAIEDAARAIGDHGLRKVVA